MLMRVQCSVAQVHEVESLFGAMSAPEITTLLGSSYKAKRGLVNMEEFLSAIGLQDQYKEAFVTNFGATSKLETLRKRLDCRALCKMGIQNFSHQKCIMNHLRSIPTKPVSPPVVSSVFDDPAVSALVDAPPPVLPPLPTGKGVLDSGEDVYTSLDADGSSPEDDYVEVVRINTAESSPARSCRWGEEGGEGSEKEEDLPPVLERLGSGTTPISHDDEVLLQRLERCASGLAGAGPGSRGERGAAKQWGVPIRSVLNKDKDTEKLMRSTWEHINTLQKEVDENVRSKRHNTIERIRSGQLVREEESQGTQPSNFRAAGAAGSNNQPPQPAPELSAVGRRSSSSAQLSTSSSAPSLDKVKDTQLRSLNYGNCALRMGLIEKHLLSVQSRIVEEVRRVIGCERASLMFVDKLNGQLFFFVNDTPIRIPADQGIAGLTAQTGDVLVLDNVYNDPRFHPQVDRETGFRTHNILSFPVRQRHGGRVIAVIQMLNKQDGFDSEDVVAVESCSLEVADELEACTETLATATAQWDKFRLTTGPRVSLTQRQTRTAPEDFAQLSLLDGNIRRFGSSIAKPLNEWNAGWTEKARVDESIRFKRRTEYGRQVVKSQYGL